MLRMEIALFLVLGFVAFIYFSAEKKYTQLHTQDIKKLLTLLHLHDKLNILMKVYLKSLIQGMYRNRLCRHG